MKVQVLYSEGYMLEKSDMSEEEAFKLVHSLLKAEKPEWDRVILLDDGGKVLMSESVQRPT